MKKLAVLFALFLLPILAGCTGSVNSSTHFEEGDQVVVLAHGLGRSELAMWRMTQRLEKAGYLVCTLDYPSIGQSVDSVLDNTSAQIDSCLGTAPKVHFIGHSLGGLVIRSYLQAHPKFVEGERFGKVVLIGTPNKGSELADHYQGSWLMELGGGISQALATGESSLGEQLEELDIELGVIAGTKSSRLTGSVFNGPNDGLVSAESTKLASMKDFVEVDVGHSSMRYNQDVAEQAIHFLRSGGFDHPRPDS